MSASVPLWVQAIVATLLILSGVLVILSAIGFSRPGDFFVRMHPTALAYTLGTWSVALAAAVRSSTLGRGVALHPLLIVVALAITVPMTTLLLARVALFRRRVAGAADTPPPITPPQDP